MDYSTKLIYQSNFWYNDGLRKANIRDLSGAIVSLRRSLQYNRSNIAARNLLGLVYYGRGDVVEALVEWILSKNFQSHDNIANYYISKVQEVPGELEEINQAVKKFNLSLDYAAQNGEDMAIIQLKKAIAVHPTYVKAYQLLALLYLKTEQYTAARQVLRTAHKLDTTDDFTLRYMHELNQIRKNRTVKFKENEKKDQQTVTYNIGNETIIQPVSTNFKERTGLHTVLNMLIGLVVGVAVMWFLVMPAVNSSRQKELNKQTVEFSDQIATQDAQISALKKELEEYRSTSEESENAKTTGESTQESYEIVMNIYKHYSDSDMSNAAMVEELIKVNPDSLGTIGLERYNEMTEKLYPKQCEKIYSEAKDNFDAENYKDAISKLTQVLQMDEGYGDGAAKLLLAQSYEKSGDKDQANALYQKLVEDYKDTDIATSAQAALDAQNAKEDE
ncbi:MAG: tetratricopeptide repeat protein [Lachnospiraceae bacterium]